LRGAWLVGCEEDVWRACRCGAGEKIAFAVHRKSKYHTVVGWPAGLDPHPVAASAHRHVQQSAKRESGRLHPTPHRQIFCTLEGEYEVTASDGTVRRFPPGSVLVLEDTWGKGHATRIVSKGENLVFGVALADAPSQ
jgi:hypothetical protein